MRLTTVAVVALLVCASFAPAAMAFGDPPAERHGSPTAADAAERTGTVLQTEGTNESTATDQSSGTNETNTSLGLRVSSFVQSTSSETAGVVDSGMWAADVTRSNRTEAVDQQVTRLRERLSTLRTERAELREAYQAGELSRLQYRSRLAALNGRFMALSTATDDTEQAATQLNTQAPGLQRVRDDLDAERKKGGLGVGRPATAGQPSATDGNESTTSSDESTADGSETQRGNGNSNRDDGNNRGSGDDSRRNGGGADSVSVGDAAQATLLAV